jgi:hypothetical protein
MNQLILTSLATPRLWRISGRLSFLTFVATRWTSEYENIFRWDAARIDPLRGLRTVQIQTFPADTFHSRSALWTATPPYPQDNTCRKQDDGNAADKDPIVLHSFRPTIKMIFR